MSASACSTVLTWKGARPGCLERSRATSPVTWAAAKLLPETKMWAETADIWADQIVIQKRFVARFRAIGTPAGDAVAVALVGKLARGVLLATRVQQGFAAHDVMKLQAALPAYVRYTLDLNRRVVAYGFRACGH